MPAPAPERPVVVLHVWGVGHRSIPGAVARMAWHRRALARPGGPAFWKLLGTGDGRTFTARDADPLHWGLLTTWPDQQQAQRFEDSPVIRSWGAIATERLRVGMSPLTSRGTWSGRTPFGSPVARKHDGAVASITRARIRTSRAASFWRSVPPVSADLHQVDGLRTAVGIGEAPIGLQGTFSLWRDSAALNDFAHRRAPHIEVVRRTATERWYAEELFARFAVDDVQGTLAGIDPTAG